MNVVPEHPTLSLPVNDTERDRATNWLQEAYADGRLSAQEFDDRVGIVLQADTRRDLNLAFYGLVEQRRHSLVRPVSAAGVPDSQRTGLGAVAWFGALVSMFLVPVLLYVIAGKGSVNRRIIADALNFQLLSLVVFVIGGILAAYFDVVAMALAVYSIGWVVTNIVGGIKALNGEPWRNPVNRVLFFHPIHP